MARTHITDIERWYTFEAKLNGLNFGNTELPEDGKTVPQWLLIGTVDAGSRAEAVEEARWAIYDMTKVDLGPDSDRIKIISWHYRDISDEEKEAYATSHRD